MKFISVAKETLLAIAGLVWFVAGANIVKIGVTAYAEQAGWIVLLLALGSVVIFGLFWSKIFSKMLKKHVARIMGYVERQPFWRFFDRQAFIIMACMMSGGIALRAFNLVPSWFIAFFYTGLGVALALAGLGFWSHYARTLKASRA
ncbi:MAG: hypothetical protein Q4B30_02755 [Coriobacteriaceae bacterium]|nr:hypothetical protein [Coriobacteriaceae bacterium]